MSDDEWDADGFQATPFVKSPEDKWAGEDEDDDAPDDWEASSDEEKSATATSTEPPKPRKKQTLDERIAEKAAKRREELEKRRLEEEEKAKALTPEEQLAAKARALKMQEDADLEVAMDTFGVSKAELPSQSPLDVTPTNKDEFDTYKTALVDKLRSMESSPFYHAFLEELVRDLCWNLDSDEVKKVSSALNALYNDKVKSKQGKSKKKKGASVKMERTAFDDYDDFI